jgi:WD40 repeat protein
VNNIFNLTPFLADDQALRIWDVQGKRQLQALEDKSSRWGQITCIKWLSAAAEGNVVCFGTGRGLILVYQGGKGLVSTPLLLSIIGKDSYHCQETFRELSNTTAFSFNDSVESVDYDRNKSRLVVSSHNGKIKMFSVDRNGKLI